MIVIDRVGNKFGSNKKDGDLFRITKTACIKRELFGWASRRSEQ